MPVQKILLVIPCFNEQANVAALSAQIAAVKIEGVHLAPLFINDSSTDDTEKELREAGVAFLSNAVNLGIGGTVQLGFQYALDKGYDAAIQLDGDGQHPAAELPKLVNALRAGDADVIIGSRFIGRDGFQSTFLRRVGIRFFSRLNKILAGVTVHDSTSGFRAYNRQALEHLVAYYPDEYPEPETILYLAHKKMRMKEIAVTMAERQGGVSSIRSLGSVYYMGKVFLNILFLHIRLKYE